MNDITEQYDLPENPVVSSHRMQPRKRDRIRSAMIFGNQVRDLNETYNMAVHAVAESYGCSAECAAREFGYMACFDETIFLWTAEVQEYFDDNRVDINEELTQADLRRIITDIELQKVYLENLDEAEFVLMHYDLPDFSEAYTMGDRVEEIVISDLSETEQKDLENLLDGNHRDILWEQKVIYEGLWD